nr:MAG: ORF1 [Torque teno midi virus]
MPFWWRRRRRRWIPRRYYRKRQTRYRRKRARIHTRRRSRRPHRRRRRRRWYKVKKKRKQLVLKQWQPDSIRNCKIKGVGVLVLGAHGKQFVCYTDVEQIAPPPKAPGGGGFGCKQFSLGYLYEEFKLRNNIWTATNINFDLCRYLYVDFYFYRHQDYDFIISFDRQPPFTLDEFTYPLCHPQNLLLGKHKIILLSKQSKPNGKLKKRVRIRPPKQMLNKWFFQEQFHSAPLLNLRASVCSLSYPHIGCCMANRMITFKALNTGFYKNGHWAQYRPETTPYIPYTGAASDLWYWDTADWPKNMYEPTDPWVKQHGFQVTATSYSTSVAYDTGYFNSRVLSAKLITRETKRNTAIAALPMNICRYNPTKDTGKGNTVWLHSNLRESYDKPSSDKTVIIAGIPLWMIFWGWLSYVQHMKKAPDFYTSYTVCIESPFIEVASSTVTPTPIIPIDDTFIKGQAPYNAPIRNTDLAHWYPDVFNQTEQINNIVCSGPYVPKLDNIRNSSWELHYYYKFRFKWGGPEITDQPVVDPSKQPIYDAFDKVTQAVQIRNPANQKFTSILHPWDLRRGIIKNKTLKRMQENLSIDTTFCSDSSPTKKRRITGPCLTALEEINQEERSCLQTLCEESTFQEIQEETDIKQLILQQQQQQHQLKYNILTLISKMKEQQNMLKLQTGLYF